MPVAASAPWHRESFDRFLNERLPQLLASRLPLAGYRVEPTGTHACCIAVALDGPAGSVELEYADIPRPDDDGVFEIDGTRRVVVPMASQTQLDVAEITCVGEQLHDFVEERLGDAPRNLPWDAALARAWLPLDAWFREFLSGREPPTAQALDDTNWLAARTHLRRLLVPGQEPMFSATAHLARLVERRELVAAGHLGRVCPFETPEGTNIGRVLSIAVGAEIRDDRLVVVDERPEAALGLTASMVPFLEHNDANRILMGVNMMRQHVAPPDPEPALVRTGNEPDAPRFWCGRNLLTAFISLGADTFEDAIVISQSCARKLDFPHPVEPGDKLSNRHGTKGTVSRIVPDDRMPRLADGTPVELVFSFIGCHTRLNFGQLREAVMSRIARAEGRPAIVPPFHSPGQAELRQRLAKAGLPESGMETLTRGGRQLPRPSAVGWVYWGKTFHLTRGKLHHWRTGSLQRQGELEYHALRDIGAFETIAEHFNLRDAGAFDDAARTATARATDQEKARTLAAHVAAGPVEQAGPPTPRFAELVRRLAACGVRSDLQDGKLTFRFAPPAAPGLELGHPVPHPWSRERQLSRIGALDELPGYVAVVEANARLERILASQAPESLVQQSLAQLEARVHQLFDALLAPAHMRPGARVLFSSRTVISPGPNLRLDQLGLAEELAWGLFAPLVERQLRNDAEVAERTEQAAQALDAVMERSWVILNRAPTIMPTALLSFRPIRCPGNVIRIHPLVCRLMNADFDGDQAAVFLPITEAGQREAAERLSVAGHLERDPELLRWLIPTIDATWGLAALSLEPGGLDEIAQLAGAPVAAPEGFVTRASLVEAMRTVLERDGVDATLDRLERLMRRGFEVAAASGASLSPFVGAPLALPPEPTGGEPEAWDAYAEELAERLASRTDFAGPDLGPQLLAIKSGARGSIRQLAWLLGSRGSVVDVSGALVPIRRGLRDGLTPAETYACVVGARQGLGRTALECARAGYALREAAAPKGFNVLVRAMRSSQPGRVFARAAATGEIDPLTDLDSRLFVGLPPQ